MILNGYIRTEWMRFYEKVIKVKADVEDYWEERREARAA
jgi:hypothetical protein